MPGGGFGLKCTTGQTFPEPASCLTNVGRQDGCVPRLDSIYKETVGQAASGGVVGVFFDADGAELRDAVVNVPIDGGLATCLFEARNEKRVLENGTGGGDEIVILDFDILVIGLFVRRNW